MLTKKLKKVGKACRKTGNPALLTLAAYADHVVDYLERAEAGDAAVKAYGDALAGVDLSAVVKAREALAVAEPAAAEPDAVALPLAGSGAAEAKPSKTAKKVKKAKKKEARSEKKDEDVPAPSIQQEAAAAPEHPVESDCGQRARKAKREKQKDK